MFTPRPAGVTLKRDLEAILNPHPAYERFDPDFPVTMKCEKCGKHAFGPRKHMSEAMREHHLSDCSARRTRPDDPQIMRILYPKQ